MKDIKTMTDEELIAEYGSISGYLEEVVSNDDLIKQELLAREIERRGLELPEEQEVY
jgi:hypothetical protein